MKIPVHASSVWRARAIVLPGASVWCFSSRFSFSSRVPFLFLFPTVCKTFCIQVTHFHVPQSAAGFDVLSPCTQFWNWNCFVVDVQCSSSGSRISCMCSHVAMESPCVPVSCNVPLLTLRLSTNAAGNGKRRQRHQLHPAIASVLHAFLVHFACAFVQLLLRYYCYCCCCCCSPCWHFSILICITLLFLSPRFRLSSTLSLRWNSMRN